MTRKPKCQTHEEVMFYDTDAGGVVHNIAYLRFVEKARTLLGSKLGLSLKEMSQSGLYAVVTRTEIDYIKPAVLGDRLTIEGRLENVSRVRFSCAFEVLACVSIWPLSVIIVIWILAWVAGYANESKLT